MRHAMKCAILTAPDRAHGTGLDMSCCRNACPTESAMRFLSFTDA